jgi:hypothetical protein
MAHGCSVSKSKHRRHAPAFEAESCVANGVNTAMKGVQSPGSNPTVDALPEDSCCVELRAADHAVLPRGNSSNNEVASGGVVTHMVNKPPTLAPLPFTAGFRRGRDLSDAGGRGWVLRILSAPWLPPLSTASRCVSSSTRARSRSAS